MFVFVKRIYKETLLMLSVNAESLLWLGDSYFLGLFTVIWEVSVDWLF